jgi:hypothetical protein
VRGAFSKTILIEDGRGNIYVLDEWNNSTIHHFFVKPTNLDIKYCGEIAIHKREAFCSIGVDGENEVLYVGYSDVVDAYKLTYI